MNQETKRALLCGVQLRELVTKLVDAIRYVDVVDRNHSDLQYVRMQQDELRKAVLDVRRLLQERGLYEINYPIDPQDGEDLRHACRRIFGLWISNDVMDRKEGT